MVINLNNWLPILVAVVSVSLLLGGSIATLRQGYSRTAVETQEKVIIALREQITTLEDKVKAGEVETARLRRVVEVIQKHPALERRGLRIEINGETITLIEGQSRSHTVRIRKDSGDLKTVDIKED